MVVVTRELTKLYETVVRGPLGTIDIGDPRGEYVFVLAGAPVEMPPIDDETIRDALRAELAARRIDPRRGGRRGQSRFDRPSATSTPSPSPSTDARFIRTRPRANRAADGAR